MSHSELIARIWGIIEEWDKGCSHGPAGACAYCSEGALRAIESAILSKGNEIDEVLAANVELAAKGF